MSVRWIWIGYNHLISNKHEWNNCFIKFFKLQTSGYYNWILRNLILNNITKWPDIDVTSDIKPRENHMSAPFTNLVEWKNLKEFKQITQVKGKCLS